MAPARVKPAAAPPGWQCPDCGRSFKQRTREHSCDTTSLETHLAKTSAPVREAFAEVLRVLDEAGPYDVVAVKTMVVLRARSNFGGVTFTKVRLDLGFFLDEEIRDPRLHKTERISARKIAHHLYLGSKEDVDETVRGWLRQAHGLAVRPG